MAEQTPWTGSHRACLARLWVEQYGLRQGLGRDRVPSGWTSQNLHVCSTADL
jgi:hypothetical protein